jgi:N6-adenosine-specific RNA methylase IME4
MAKQAKPSRLDKAKAALVAGAIANDGGYPFHAYADLFPLIEGAAFDALVGDVRAKGLVEKITLWRDTDGKTWLLDGRNRWRACRAAGVEPVCGFYRGDDPLGFVISKNLPRRHLSESQRAMVAAKIANLRDGVTKTGAAIDAPVSQGDAGAMLNVSRESVQRATKVREHGAPELVSTAADLATLTRAEQAEMFALSDKQILAKAKEIRAAKQVERRAERFDKIRAISAANAPLDTSKQYPVIYADPPWEFKAGDSDRSTENHYPTMSFEKIAALDIGGLATKDALLFLWVRGSLAFDRRLVPMIESWGFAVVSHCVWAKPSIGTGFWFREMHEPLLVCKRGDFPAPLLGKAWKSVIDAPRGEVSEKPHLFYELIEAYAPDVPRVELFARQTPLGKHLRPGWDAWGNQAAIADDASEAAE